MTSRESEILNIIYRLGDWCPMRIISKETGLGSAYAFLIIKKLLDQKLIKKIANDVFILTANGRLFLEPRTPPTCIGESYGFGSKIHFFNPEAIPPQKRTSSLRGGSRCHEAGREFTDGESRFTEDNLGKDITIEVTDARSIQESLKRLIED